MDLFDVVRTQPLDVVPMPPDEEFHARFIGNRKPVIVDSIADRMAFIKQWSFDYFADRLGTIRVQRPAADGLYHYLGFEHIPFSVFRQELETGNSAYAFETLIDPVKMKAGASGPFGVDQKFSLPGFIPPKTLYSSNLWIGAGGNRSLLHYDHVNSLLIVMEGRKRFVLFGPEQTWNMYPYSVLNLKSIKEGRVLDSKVNAAKLDLDQFPRIRKAVGLYGELLPGQALFIPAGTWHYIESHGLNVAVNYFWYQTPIRDWVRRPLLEYLIKRCIIVGLDQVRRIIR